MNAIIIIISIFSLSLFSNKSIALSKTDDNFSKLITIERDGNGKIITLKLRKQKKFDFLKFVNTTRMEIQAYKQSKTFNLQSFSNSYNTFNNEPLDDSNQKNIRLAMQALRENDFEKIFSDQKFQELMRAYNDKINDSLLASDIIARPQNPTYFYTTNMEGDILSWASSLAQTALHTTPAINLAFFLFQKSIDQIAARRTFYQYMALYNIENVRTENLGFTPEELNEIRSSLYEAQIDWYEFWKSNRAKNDWEHYGTNQYNHDLQTANDRLDDHKADYEYGERLNFAFITAKHNNQPIILNGLNRRTLLSSSPSIAYDFQNEQKIRTYRISCEMLELGISLAPIPGPISFAFVWFLQKSYWHQTQTEGALFGYFQAIADIKKASVILAQTANQYIWNDF